MVVNWDQFFASRVDRMNGSQIRNFFSLTESPEVISFAGGFPDSRSFPQELLGEEFGRLMEEKGQSSLQYSPTEGNGELKGYLVSKMLKECINCKPEEIVITDGTQQALDLLFKVLVHPQDPVFIEEPTYIGGVGALKSYGGDVIGISMDNKGLIPEELKNNIMQARRKGKTPKLLYTIPNFQNPTGITTAASRREEIYRLASKYDMLIVEDNPYGELCFEGEVPCSYKSMDGEGRVIYLGSYSKNFLPGIRVGWIVAPVPLIEKVVLAKQTADLCSSSLGQSLAYRFSVTGYVDQHLRGLIKYYREKRDAMLSALEKYFPSSISYTRPQGGFFIWVSLPPYYPPAAELLQQALENKVAFVPGDGFFVNESGSHAFRLSYSQNTPEEIEEGIKRIGELCSRIEKENEKSKNKFKGEPIV